MTSRATLLHAARDTAIAPAATAMAWLGAGHRHEAIAVPAVVLEAGDVLIEVELATVCGSDVHTVAGHREAPTPLVLGHEYVGRVAAIRDDVRAADGSRLVHGDRVVWSVMAACGECDRCARAVPQKCRHLFKYGHERITPHAELSGGFATHVQVRAGTTIVRVGEDLPASVWAPATCATATAAAALERASDIVDAEVVLIVGAGLIGVTAAAMARARGARVIVAEIDPERARRATQFGADAVIDPRGAHALTGALDRLHAAEVSVVIEASGSPAGVRFALDSVGVAGAVILVGSVFPTEAQFVDPEQIVRRQTTIRGVHNYRPDDLRCAVDFLTQHAASFPFASLVSATFGLGQIDDALQAAASGTHVRVGVDPRG